MEIALQKEQRNAGVINSMSLCLVERTKNLAQACRILHILAALLRLQIKCVYVKDHGPIHPARAPIAFVQ